jgi:uncharacterized membrane protein
MGVDNMVPKSLLYPEIATSFARTEAVLYQTSSAFTSMATTTGGGTGGTGGSY